MTAPLPVVTAPLRIANCSGFYGDRLAAAREMVDGGPIDVLTGDWLAELTMLILWKGYQRDPTRGWAHTFLTQMEDVLGTCVERGIKVVTNAGGLNPAGLADQIRLLSDRLGLSVSVAHIEGDDLLPRLDELQSQGHPMAHLDTGAALDTAPGTVVSANAYLGAWPIVDALGSGADVVICPRVTDASLVVGPAAWHHGWTETDWDELAGAVVAGHVIECGPQVTGGNYAFFTEVPGMEHPGFPIAEVASDGSSVITKHPGTGGEVSVGTVTAQLLYEIGGHHYANTDVVARFETIEITDQGNDRVLLSGTRGLPAPRDVKVCLNLLGGWRNSMTFVLTGLDIEAKADLTVRSLGAALGGTGQFTEFDARLIRSDKSDAPTNAADHREGHRRRPCRPPILGGRHRAGTGRLPRTQPHRATVGGHGLRRLLASTCSSRAGGAVSGPCRRDACRRPSPRPPGHRWPHGGRLGWRRLPFAWGGRGPRRSGVPPPPALPRQAS